MPPFLQLEPRLHHIGRACAALLGSSALWVSAQSFEPETDFSLTENWRWNELEPLAKYSIYKGIETKDEKLLFTSRDHILEYDGYQIKELDYPEHDSDFSPFDLFNAQGDNLLLTTSAGVFRFHDGAWTHLIKINITNGEIRDLTARSREGWEFIALSNGLYRIEDGELNALPQFTQHFSSISFDSRDRLWFTDPLSNDVGYIPFDTFGEPIVDEVRRWDLNYPERMFPWVIASPHSDEIWSTNWRGGLPARRYNEDTDTWDEVDLRHLTGNNSHSSGYRINEMDMIIFSKSAILVKHGEDWHTIGKPEFDFPSNVPFHILRRNGRLVLGGRGEKVYEIDYRTQEHGSYHGLHFQCDAPGRNQWFISIGGQIVEHHLPAGVWKTHTENTIDTPTSIIRTTDGTIWASGAHQGVAAIAYYNGINWERDTFPELNALIGALSARQLPDGRIIFGSGEDAVGQREGGVVIYDRVGKHYEYRVHSPPYVPTRPVGIAAGLDDTIWFGGLALTSTDHSFANPIETNQKFSRSLWIDHVIEDSQSQIWMAQWERGLFTLIDGEWIERKISTEIADSQVGLIMRDEHRPGNMWVATNRGISRFDGERWYPQAVPRELRFNRESGTLRQSSDGAIWINFATRNWYFRRSTSFYITKRLNDVFKTVRFQPDENPPRVEIVGEIPRSTAPSNVQILWKGVDQWSITPEVDLKYSYRLNGGAWSEFTRGSSTVLLDMPSGKHRFELRALDGDGNLSIATVSQDFVVVPPLWQRFWFVAVVVITLATIIVLTLLLFRQRIRHLVKLEEFKLQFFTNISHELRTPLTVILAPLESQLEQLPPGWNKRPLEIAYKNAQRTLGLIDQILDFRRAETGKITLNLARADLSATVRDVFELIRPLADERSQVIKLIRESDHCPAWYDAGVIEKILNNLISNSVKYTQVGGAITVRFRTTESVETLTAEFVVEDNGRGIPAENRGDIFEAFYRISTADGPKVRGSGIGLAYTKNLVEACQGEIRAESPITTVEGKAQGTRFTVSLPLKRAAEITNSEDVQAESEVVTSSENPKTESAAPFSADDDRLMVLIAEDDDEIRNFLSEELAKTYRVLPTCDGAEALEVAQKQIPDLVLTDVMMPELDGKELCRQLKSREATSHIPIIMLTALKSEMHELEGLEIGADDYLSKPVKLVILRQRIHNLIESRKKLHDRFKQLQREEPLVASEITSNQVDEAFMEKAVQVVEKHIEDPLFDVGIMASQLFMSRMTLYRKFKAITGDTPGAFIRSIRMNKAAGLLATGEYNVSETAERVGFTDLSSFSTAFKNYFNVPPSKFTKRR
ncbi:MAG: hypothetical protein SynsKO_40840 [Synoicihabitans sp.]